MEVEEEWEFLTEEEMQDMNWSENLIPSSFAAFPSNYLGYTIDRSLIIKGTHRRSEAALRGQEGLQEDRVLDERCVTSRQT